MLNTLMLLDAAKVAQSIPSDYRLARVLGVTDNTLYNWRHGRTPDDERALKLASMARLNAGFVLLSMAAERAKDPATRAALIDSVRVLAAAIPAQTLDILSNTVRAIERPKAEGTTLPAAVVPANFSPIREYTLWIVC